MFKKLIALFGEKKSPTFYPGGRVCAFTGHRPQNLPFRFDESDKRCVALKKQLRDLIIQLIEQHYVAHFISGMAIGVDMYAAEIVLDLKAKYPHITLEAAIPCETQAVKWSEPLRERYFKIAEQCDIETMLQKQYTSDCMQKRNHYMVDRADVLLAVWDGTPSGTGSTIQYAKTQGKTVWILSPHSFEVNYIH